MGRYSMFMHRKTHYCHIVILPSFIHKFDEVSVKTPPSGFVDINEVFLKFLWRGKRPRIAHSILKDKNRGPILLNFETFKLSTL